MSSQKMTTGLSLKINKITEMIGSKLYSQLQKQLKQRGLRLDINELAFAIENLSPRLSRDAIGRILNFVRPYTSGLGLRVVRLNNEEIEIAIPMIRRNLDSQKMWQGSVLMAAAHEAVRIYWARHIDFGRYAIEFVSFKTKMHSMKAHSDLRIQYGFLEEERENLLYQLRTTQTFRVDQDMLVLDMENKKVAELKIQLRVSLLPALADQNSEKTWKS
jgi:hypothetical protein